MDGPYNHKDLRLIERAQRERWPIPDGEAEILLKGLGKALRHFAEPEIPNLKALEVLARIYDRFQRTNLIQARLDHERFKERPPVEDGITDSQAEAVIRKMAQEFGVEFQGLEPGPPGEGGAGEPAG